MPTPFTHLETAQRLLVDETIPADIRAYLNNERPAFLLGSIAADARINGNLNREDTHFYSYDKGISSHPWRVMVSKYPDLLVPVSPAQRAFVAGYVGHLSMDEIWSLEMLGPHFANREWGSRTFRFLMLHILLISMDERDYERLELWHSSALAAAEPHGWARFMSDTVLQEWRDYIRQQLRPNGISETLQVLGSRINKSADELRSILDSREQMDHDLWVNVAPEVLISVEQSMYIHAREQLCTYWEESQESF